MHVGLAARSSRRTHWCPRHSNTGSVSRRGWNEARGFVMFVGTHLTMAHTLISKLSNSAHLKPYCILLCSWLTVFRDGVCGLGVRHGHILRPHSTAPGSMAHCRPLCRVSRPRVAAYFPEAFNFPGNSRIVAPVPRGNEPFLTKCPSRAGMGFASDGTKCDMVLLCKGVSCSRRAQHVFRQQSGRSNPWPRQSSSNLVVS